jgi:DNA-binding response OmpR family regulator
MVLMKAVLAEDNPADVMLVREAIQMHALPIDLKVIQDGQQAFEFIEESESDDCTPSPELLILDLNLPRRDGQQILKRARQSSKYNQVPIVIITSSDSPRDRAETERLGANRYFRKPSNFDEFMKLGEVLREVLAPKLAQAT